MKYQQVLEQIPGSVAWKDKNFKYLGCNKTLLQELNFQSSEDMIGQDDIQIGHNSIEVNTLFKQYDQLALNGTSSDIVIATSPDKNAKIHTVSKGPLRNEQGEITGIIYHCGLSDYTNLIRLMTNHDSRLETGIKVPNYYAFQLENNPSKLSQRELECLFFLLRSRTSQEIAQIFSLSKRTIESYIENIKDKFGCNSKTDLIISAVTNHYHHYIPKTLLNYNLEAIIS